MGSTRRSFSEEYKAQAIAFVIDEHRSVAEVARNIGVHAVARLRGNPGVRRMHAGLNTLGYPLSRKRVWRLMRAANRQGRHWLRAGRPPPSTCSGRRLAFLPQQPTAP